MEMLLGLLMITGQIFGVVRLFGGAKNSPYWLDCVTAIFLILMLVSMFGLVSDL